MALTSIAHNDNHDGCLANANHFWHDFLYNGHFIPAVRCISDILPQLFGSNQYDHLGILELGQNFLSKALAKASWVAFQYRTGKKFETVFLFRPIWR